MIDWRAVVAVAAGAAIGGVLRYVVGQLFLQRFGPGFPYGTLFINVSGSFLIGIVAQLALTRAFGITPLVRLLLATGILGGYTTFCDVFTRCAHVARVRRDACARLFGSVGRARFRRRGTRRRSGATCAALSRKMLAVGRHIEILQWSNRYDARRIDVIVRAVVVALDMVEVNRRRDARNLIQIP